MGRYTTVQNFADTGSASGAIPYEKATGGMRTDPDAKGPTLRVPVVQNVTGSAAGAGSGLFHIYRHERRRENERLKRMDEDHTQMSAEQEFRARQEAARLEAEERTRKRAEKRKKRKEKARTKRRRDAGPDGLPVDDGEESHSDTDGEGEAGGESDKHPGNERTAAASVDHVTEAAGRADEPSERRKVPVAPAEADRAVLPALDGVDESFFANDGGFFERYLERRKQLENTTGEPSSDTSKAALPENAAAAAQ